MIPKIIHYCWFGRNAKSPLIEKCIQTWTKYLPEYEVIEWNEDNFNTKQNNYVNGAYNSKKWAFVSDYVRLWALNKYGGIYLDTDVEILKSLNQFLPCKFFSGFENYLEKLQPITAVMGAEKENGFIAELLSEYEMVEFINKNGRHNMITNTQRITQKLIHDYGVDPCEDKHQIVGDDINIYPSDYFCNISERSFAIHHFAGSWLPLKKRLGNKLLKITRKISKLFK